MSEEAEAVAASSCCASCGIAEIDDIKLMPCDDCDLVRYCGEECQSNHKSEHEEACKKRSDKLRDELLFQQPESSCFGDCPICCLPLPIELKTSTIMGCCSKIICDGCFRANWIREIEASIALSCPFCRKPRPKSEQEHDKLRMKRVKANDPVAMHEQGREEYKKGDFDRAFEYFTNAAALGDAEAHYNLAALYRRGEGVDKDEGKKIHHLEEAAIGGHPEARYALGFNEMGNGNPERAVKHWIIAATLGHDDAMKKLMTLYKKGYVCKEDIAATLRAHQVAVNATKSPQRKEAEE